jgi:hypothetical protein
MLAFVDLDTRDGVAMALVGKSVELAIAAIFAGAIDQLAAFELPIGHHFDLRCTASGIAWALGL